MTNNHHLSVFWQCILFTFIALLTVFVLGGVCAAGPKKEVPPVNCDVQNGSCTLPLGAGKVTLEVLPRPVKAMTDLTFHVTGEGLPDKSAPYIDLNMSAMDMGKNRVLLKSNGQGDYEGKGVIVRCRSGIRTWSAKVTFPGAGTAEFIFDVIY